MEENKLTPEQLKTKKHFYKGNDHLLATLKNTAKTGVSACSVIVNTAASLINPLINRINKDNSTTKERPTHIKEARDDITSTVKYAIIAGKEGINSLTNYTQSAYYAISPKVKEWMNPDQPTPELHLTTEATAYKLSA